MSLYGGQQILVTRLGQRGPVAFDADHAGMRVTIDQAGNHEPAVEIEAFRRFADMGFGATIIADVDESCAFDRYGLRPGVPRIFGVNSTAGQHSVGTFRR